MSGSRTTNRKPLLGEDDECPVRQAVETIDDRNLPLVLAARGREHDLKISLRKCLGGTGENSRKVGGKDERHEDTDEPGAPGGQAPRTAVGGVPVLADHSAHELPGLLRNVSTPVQDPRNGRDRDPGEIGDLADVQTLRSLGHVLH